MDSFNRTALILIDIQKGLDEVEYYGGKRNNPDAENNARLILEFFRKNRMPVYHVKHNSTNSGSPLHPEKPGNEIKELVKPIGKEPVFGKTVNSAFIGTDLENELKKDQIQHLVIIGLTLEHCISTSVRMASNLGFKVTLISDATAAFQKHKADGSVIGADVVFEVNIESLREEFATIMETKSLLSIQLAK